jgi:aminopeptidase N
VAVGDFNSGAMENKGPTSSTPGTCWRANTATDNDYVNIDRVVATVLHNWTGDRVTCRDWFSFRSEA